jgi:hypothetical protein
LEQNVQSETKKLESDLNTLSKNESLNIFLSDNTISSTLNSSQQNKLSKQLMNTIAQVKSEKSLDQNEQQQNNNSTISTASQSNAMVKYELFFDPQKYKDDKWSQIIHLENRLSQLERLIGINTPPTKVCVLHACL